MPTLRVTPGLICNGCCWTCSVRRHAWLRKMIFGKARTASFTIRADTRCSRQEGVEYVASSFQPSSNS